MTVIQRNTLWFLLWFLSMLAAALGIDFLLHLRGYAPIGSYLGAIGLVAVLLSLLPYSSRKHRIIHFGNPATFLRLHQSIAWIGSVLVIVHAGIHTNALLPWLALAAMIATVASGLVSVFLLRQARKQLNIKSLHLAQGPLASEEEENLYWDAMTVEFLTGWRAAHLFTAAALTVLTAGHVASILIFGGWR